MNNNYAITKECVRILYGNATASNMTVILSSIIIVYIFQDHIPHSHLLGWAGSMWVFSLIRFWLLSDYKKNQDKIKDHKIFENRYIYPTTGIGLSWAILIYWGLNLPLFEYQLYSLLLLTAIVAIASPLFSSSIKTLYLYLAPSVLIALPILILGNNKNLAIGIALCIFTFMVIRSSKNTHNTLINALKLRFNTQTLNENINQLHNDKLKSKQHMQGLMDYAPAAIYIKDLDGHFTFINKKVANLHKMTNEQIIGKTLYDILPRDIADAIHQNDVEVIRQGSPIKYEESAPQEDGLHRYISNKFPLYDGEGEICAIAGVSTDITERFRIEESLRITQQRLLLHREQSPLGVIEWNTDFEFIDWNPAAEKIFGFTKEEVQGQHITDRILPESARPTINKIWDDLFANKGGSYSLNKNTTKDGRTILCEWHNTPLVDSNGNIIGVTSLVEDVTKRQQNEDNLRHSQKMDAIGKLTGGIAHDFNNMLGVISGFSQLLKEQIPEENPKLVEYNEQVISAAERAVKLTSKLLEFSRKSPSSAELTQLNTLLIDMQNMLKITLTPRITLKFNFDDDIWPVWLDKTRLEDAILNMSINAMHAMPDGGTLTISIENKRLTQADVTTMEIDPGDFIMITVEDTGIGMSREIQNKIFDPFFTTKGSNGTGLGLSQVYGFVQQLKGEIHVSSELNQGTQIALYIPRYNESNVYVAETSASKENKYLFGNETILIVDDEKALLELSSEILSSHNYKVLRATSAEQALEILKANSIDLVLSDVIMPGMDGFQLAAEIEKKYPSIKIQMVSGYINDINESIKNNPLYKMLIHKPVDTNKLLERIRNLLDE